MAREQRLEVKVPTPDEDRPRFARVGIIAGVGFAIGIAWPWLAGVKLVPSPPSEDAPAAATSAAPEPAPSAPPPAAKPPPSEPSAPVAPEPGPKRLKVGKSSVTSCKDARGNVVSDCDMLDVDALMLPHVEALQSCPGTEGGQGVLSLGARISFRTNRVERVMQGKSTSLPHNVAKALLSCARRELADVTFESVKHNQDEYTVFFLLELTSGAEPARGDEGAPPASGEITPMTGTATVSWQAAKVRGEPSKDAKELARLMSGTRVIVTGRQGSWYRVKYGAKNDEGWLYKSAIGL